ncbi:GDSL esterase/lipase At1g29670-like [Vitis riparia]|uniref:GDSL esterase/lipase At1g29670-like n=1 Tax=Vitis riparia TaxID=96939 RepID=UPI00155A231A|nr:GDSL esterase/lipase At1g29670-like [Vitis riparia]
MASTHQKIWWSTVLLFGLSNLQHGTLGDPQVPCYFILGDSLSDSGNNNALSTLAKVNYLPYGIDFPQGPTGRFCNGRTVVDVIAELLGFNSFVPPFATAEGEVILKGVNYASGGSGIRDESGQNLGDRISMNEQLENYQTTVSQINDILGSDTAAATHLNKCLFTVGIGSNDYINNYLMPDLYPTSRLYTPDQYAEALIEQYSQQLKTLYGYGARKLALFGLGLIGCAPAELASFGPSPGSNCVDAINDAVRLFNTGLVSLIDDLNKNFTDAKFTYINFYEIGSTNLTAFGFKVTNMGCCGGQNACLRSSTPCQNRSEYAFWDQFHSTEAVNLIFGQRAYKSQTPSDAYPIDISTLAQL